MPCIATMLITLMNVISKLRERFIGEPLSLNIVLLTTIDICNKIVFPMMQQAKKSQIEIISKKENNSIFS
jgi:hypothetical protein